LDHWLHFRSRRDFQLARFKSDPSNKGKVLIKVSGNIHVTRTILAILQSGGDLDDLYLSRKLAACTWISTNDALIIKYQGVALLEKSLREQKPEYKEYIKKRALLYRVAEK
jgi:steroid 5-alpha reductase family enzyme